MKKAIQIRYDEKFNTNCKYVTQAGFKIIAISFEGMTLRTEEALKTAEYMNSVLEKYRLTCVQTHLPCYSERESSEVFNAEMEESIHAAVRISGEIGAAW